MSEFLHSISSWPKASIPDAVQHVWERLLQAQPQLAAREEALRPAVAAVAGNSPFLADLLVRHAEVFLSFCEAGPDQVFAEITHAMMNEANGPQQLATLQKLLRVTRQKVALVIALADIAGVWEVMTVTDHLTAFADAALEVAGKFLLRQAAEKGELVLPPESDGVEGSGVVLLAMGKHGAHELNYSSDIDLILLFDPEQAQYQGRKTIQHFYNQFAQGLITLLDQRTADGYVFRLDLRLRPDPRSTPLAVNLYSAVSYYESLGQNWERAAMIKSRPVLADTKSLEVWRSHIRPFIWRAHLDYAAVQDIQSIRRQISIKTGEDIDPAGFNVKLGTGGIREIELYVQSQQLIWGGRHPELRLRGTLRCLQALADEELIARADAEAMTEAYLFYRMVEHRLQMVADQQTHSLPEDVAARARIAVFCGFETREAFEAKLLAYLQQVHGIYVAGLAPDSSLAVDAGNLVFTGVDADPETLKTLERLGFTHTKMISDTIQDWHRGTRRATRTLRARQLLTELVPLLLHTLGETREPDETFRRLDQFISRLPAGVQLFSLFTNQPDVMRLVIMILGVAPDLGDTLSKHPQLLDSVMSDSFYEALADRAALDVLLEERLLALHDPEDDELWLRTLRQFKQEYAFQAGVQLITGRAGIEECNLFLSDLADCMLQHVLSGLLRRFSEKYGSFPGMDVAVVAMGRLGAQELTFHSDVDLMLLYQVSAEAGLSDGEKQLDAGSYFHRFASRYFNALSMLTREGQLYEVDNRLRPHGVQGPLATRFEAFQEYYRESAWVVEIAGLCKARVVATTDSGFASRIEEDIRNVLRLPRERMQLMRDLADIRSKMRKQNPPRNSWDVKHAQGGLIDLDFIAHYLQLLHAHAQPEMLSRHSMRVFESARWLYLMPDEQVHALLQACRIQRDVLSILRLCAQDVSEGLPQYPGLRHFMLKHFETDDTAELAPRLEQLQQEAWSVFCATFLQ